MYVIRTSVFQLHLHADVDTVRMEGEIYTFKLTCCRGGLRHGERLRNSRGHGRRRCGHGEAIA